MAVLTAAELAPGILRALTALGWDRDNALRPAGIAGSGRSYWRAYLDDGTMIVQVNPPTHPDTPRFLDTSRACREAGLPVARIHAHDEDQILLDDLGGERLWDRVQTAGSDCPELRQAVVLIRRLQAVADGIVDRISWLPERAFDEDHLLWETAYFRDHCWLARRQPEGNRQAAFDDARQALAKRVLDHPQTVVHRDYQSQNLMLDGEQLAMIDHQGARWGSIYYDLASIAFDPYLELPSQRIRGLFELYCRNHPLINDGKAAWAAFLDAAAQRVMQANGAYGFLTRGKGLAEFERWREPGWRQLRVLLDWHAAAWGDAVLRKAILCT